MFPPGSAEDVFASEITGQLEKELKTPMGYGIHSDKYGATFTFLLDNFSLRYEQTVNINVFKEGSLVSSLRSRFIRKIADTFLKEVPELAQNKSS